MSWGSPQIAALRVGPLFLRPPGLPEDLTDVQGLLVDIVVWLIVGRLERGQPTTDFEPCRFDFVEVGQEKVPVH